MSSVIFYISPMTTRTSFTATASATIKKQFLAITDRLARHGLKYNDTAAAQFSYSDWRYYMARYNNANWQWSGYGCYAWRDYTSAPLEVYILNSSLFGENNLAWSMMLNIVHNNIPRNGLAHGMHTSNLSNYRCALHARLPPKRLGVAPAFGRRHRTHRQRH